MKWKNIRLFVCEPNSTYGAASGLQNTHNNLTYNIKFYRTIIPFNLKSSKYRIFYIIKDCPYVRIRHFYNFSAFAKDKHRLNHMFFYVFFSSMFMLCLG